MNPLAGIGQPFDGFFLNLCFILEEDFLVAYHVYQNSLIRNEIITCFMLKETDNRESTNVKWKLMSLNRQYEKEL